MQPKKDQESKVTRQVCKSKLKPETLKVGIDKVVIIRKGRLLIACGSKDDKDRLAMEAMKQLGDEYVIKTPERNRPKVRIYDIEDKLRDYGLIQCLVDQNSDVFSVGMPFGTSVPFPPPKKSHFPLKIPL